MLLEQFHRFILKKHERKFTVLNGYQYIDPSLYTIFEVIISPYRTITYYTYYPYLIIDRYSIEFIKSNSYCKLMFS
ncbi:hypothetical protein EV197_2143 [Aquimarina brevivitae]|uniref:Uncharacterized protein n=1 Tax=Aquimarina brevivitae TaxID=323412 RepID=A0A4Q7P166_9FLAO|nr:hypothetical protein EV197_2143 [Aquimarina brevivitae]